jgi:PAS domain-containing protein
VLDVRRGSGARKSGAAACRASRKRSPVPGAVRLRCHGRVSGSTATACFEANEAFLDLVGYSRRKCLKAGSSGRRSVRRTCEATKRALRELADTGVVRPFEKELFRKDGTRIPSWSAVP